MSRSVRKTPVCSNYICACGDTEKEDKKLWHHKMRARIRIVLRNADGDSVFLPDMREVSDVWNMAKEGKLRFDPVERPKLMRK